MLTKDFFQRFERFDMDGKDKAQWSQRELKKVLKNLR